MLEPFTALVPAVGVALLDADSRLFARAGNWPGDSFADAVTAVGNAAHVDEVEAVAGDEVHCCPLVVGAQMAGTLIVRSGSSPPNHAFVRLLCRWLPLLLAKAHEAREVAQEALAGYRELNLLYRVAETIAGSLDANTIPQLVLDEAHHIIRADAGLVTLGDVAASFGDEGAILGLRGALDSVIDELWTRNRPAILSDVPGAGARWGSLLWAPLRTTDRVLGGIVLGRHAEGAVFAANDEKLLMALAGPSALALQNAHLFGDLHRTLDRTLEMKTLMDDIVGSIASGVLTTDRHGQLTFLNDVAAHILGIASARAVGRPLAHVLPPALSRLGALIGATAERGAVTLNHLVTATVPPRGPVHFYVSCTPLRDGGGGTAGAAVVINDMTDQRRVEAERERIRETFGRVVAPRVRDRLLAAPENLRLDGNRQTVTVLFADLHGFTPFCERLPPEAAFEVLNGYLSLAADAVLAEEGTLDKFIGDAVMAFWNAPDAQPDHALRAVRTALAIGRAMAEYSTSRAPNARLAFSIGINTGEAIVGNVGTSQLFNYTVIGDTVNLAQRVEALAPTGGILLSESTYAQVSARVVAPTRREVRVKGREQPVIVYELQGLGT